MGLFLNVLIAKDSKEEEIRSVLEKLGSKRSNWNLIPADCQYKENSSGTAVLINEMCAAYEDLPKQLSKSLPHPVMLCFIYDGDFWGYDLFKDGKELDTFCPVPDYFEEVSEEERQRVAGNSKLLAEYFGVEEEQIKNYLQQWTDELLDSDEELRAYEGDEFCIGEDWQMADFMRAIGFPYEW